MVTLTVGSAAQPKQTTTKQLDESGADQAMLRSDGAVNKANSDGGLIERDSPNGVGNRISVAIPANTNMEDYRERNDQSVAATEKNKASVVSAQTES